MQKYISIKDGYSCKAVNPFNKDFCESRQTSCLAINICECLKANQFESTNPELPLTEHVEVGRVFEGEIQHQYQPQDEDHLQWLECSESFYNALMRGNAKANCIEIIPVRLAIHPTQTVGEGEKENKWLQGYACAVAALCNMGGLADTQTIELYKSGIGKLTEDELRLSGVGDYDIEAFLKHGLLNTNHPNNER